jgi:protein-S-isoprenylcysteine O-methyltransferase Ste14
MFGVHPDLRRYVAVASSVSVALAIAGLVSLVHGLRTSGQWLFVVFGVIALSSSFLGIVVVPRWYPHATRVVSMVTPKAEANPSYRSNQ